MKLHGLRSLIYATNDLKKDIEWWTEQLGYKPYFTADEYAGFNVGGYEIGLFVTDINFSAGGVTYMGVDDVDTTYTELIDSGSEPHEKPVEVGGGIKMASVKNEHGHIIGLIYNPHFKLEGN